MNPPPAPKLVVLRRGATVYDAARAMKDNHVGAVLVADRGRLAGIVTDRDVALAVARDDFDAHRTALEAIMGDIVGACEAAAGVEDVLTTMRQYACRRVPLVREGRPVGLVTLDDLVLDGRASPADLRAIVAAQLERPSRLKPAGSVRPVPLHPAPGEDEPPSQRRRASRAESSYRALVREVARRTAVDSPERAEAALGIVLQHLCRRLPPDDARRLLAGLPPRARASLSPDPEGPDETITIDTVAEALRGELDLLPDAAADILLAVADAVRSGTGDDAKPLRERFPAVLQEMFPRRRRRSGQVANGSRAVRR